MGSNLRILHTRYIKQQLIRTHLNSTNTLNDLNLQVGNAFSLLRGANKSSKFLCQIRSMFVLKQIKEPAIKNIQGNIVVQHKTYVKLTLFSLVFSLG